jgi:hypothetical protein
MRMPAPPRVPASERPAATEGNTRGVSGSRADGGERVRSGRPSTGGAVQREAGRTGGFPPSAVNTWYGDVNRLRFEPRYYYGYSLYNPYSYGSRWSWGRYGMWYDPFDPFGYSSLYMDPFYGPGGYGGGYMSYGGGSVGGAGSYYGTRSAPEFESTGSVRLRVKPSQAKVYLDGTLMGIVDQFDGLTSHLAAPAGTHEIEVRADGYNTLKLTVDVEPDRTVTARGSLKKQ